MLLNEVSYISSIYPPESGVSHKINGFLSAVESIGYKSHLCEYSNGFFSTLSCIYKTLVSSNSKFIIIRYSPGWINCLFFPAFIIARFQRRKLIADVPTPMRSVVTEIWYNSNGTFFKKLRHTIYLYILGPVPFLFYNTILQYGNESPFFAFGNRSRTLLTGNSIDITSVQLRRTNYLNHSGRLNLVGVANISIYHGYDRVIRAIARWNSQHADKVFFYIIGDNPNNNILSDLKQLSIKLGVENYVLFCGIQNRSVIYDYYSDCDLAVGSLGLFRIGLQLSSVLKIREYCLAGIPFIAAGADPDFPFQLPFRFEVSNDDSIDDIISVFNNFPLRRLLFSDEDIRQYAFDHLSFNSRLCQIGIKPLVNL